MMYHNILFRAFASLHGNCPTMCDGDEVMPSTSEFLQSETSTELYQKVLRVKATKTYQWLQSQTSVYRMFLSTLAVTPMEQLMFCFLRWQRMDAYLRKENPPVVMMADPTLSPACNAIRSICDQLKTGKLFPHDAESILIMEAAECCSADIDRGKFPRLLAGCQLSIRL